MLAVIVMHVKNAVSSSSSNFDEAHENGRSDFIFLMCFSCAKKSEDGKKDIMTRRFDCSEITYSGGRLPSSSGQPTAETTRTDGRTKARLKKETLRRVLNRMNTNVKRKESKEGIPGKVDRKVPLTMVNFRFSCCTCRVSFQ